MNLPDSAKERRTVPRHLRDGEHEGVATTGVAGMRAEDAAPPRARGWLLLIALAALVAATLWWWFRV